MGSPDIRPQSEEFARENQFKVELQQTEGIYQLVSHKYINPKDNMVAFGIGEAHSEDELFSKIDTVVLLSVEDNVNLYSLTVVLPYQNQNNAYWNSEQAEQLKKLLTENYDYSSVEHLAEKGQHNLHIIDPDAKIFMDLLLGYENEKTAWRNQVEGAHQLLMEYGDHPLLGPSAEEALAKLKSSSSLLTLQSSMHIGSFHNDDASNLTPCDFSISTTPETVDDPKEINSFVHTVKKWAQFIENAVNAMSNVKGIPQSGKLTLIPPSEIPQL